MTAADGSNDPTGLAVDLRGVTKRFGSVVANKGVDLQVRRRSVHALVGENGAGKSTLMRVLAGLHRADAGEIWVAGARLEPNTPARAIAAGVGMVHQHFLLVPALSVAENVVVGREPRRGMFLRPAMARQSVRTLAEGVGLAVDPARRVEDLSVGEQQRVEILKALYRGAQILVLDEPTAVLTPGEVADLFAVVRNLVAAGKTAILITHKLDEVMQIADDVTVLRRGEKVAFMHAKGTTTAMLARAMVGRDVLLEVRRPAESGPPGIALLEVRDLVVRRRRRDRAPAVGPISFDVRAGEILGIAGVEGNGQTELCEAIAGLRPVSGGTIGLVAGGIEHAPVAERLEAGLAHVAEDRQGRGLVLDFSVQENLILGQTRRFSGMGVLGVLAKGRMQRHAREVLAEFDVRDARPETLVRRLSGGNQQKIVVGRELSRDAKVILAVQPTRGVDIGATEFIHQKLLEARAAGRAVLLVSADLAELLAIADRIAVMYRGRIVGTVDAAQATEETLGRWMTGATESGEAGAGSTAPAGAA